MTEIPIQPASVDEARERSLIDDVRQLAEDGRTFAEAELAYQKSRAAFASEEGKRIALAGALAAALAYFAMIALVVGLLISLATVITPWGATAVMFIGLMGPAAIFGMRAAKRWTHMTDVLSEREKGKP